MCLKYFTLILLLNIKPILAQPDKDPFLPFFEMLKSYGWTVKIVESVTPKYEGISIKGGNIKYQFPSGDGYYELLEFYIFDYAPQIKIPYSDSKLNQVYPKHFEKECFPIQNYKDLFKGVMNWEHFEYI